MHRRKGHDQKTIQIQSHLWRSMETNQMRLILQDCRIDSCMDCPGHPFSNRERNPLRVPRSKGESRPGMWKSLALTGPASYFPTQWITSIPVSSTASPYGRTLRTVGARCVRTLSGGQARPLSQLRESTDTFACSTTGHAPVARCCLATRSSSSLVKGFPIHILLHIPH